MELKGWAIRYKDEKEYKNLITYFSGKGYLYIEGQSSDFYSYDASYNIVVITPTGRLGRAHYNVGELDYEKVTGLVDAKDYFYLQELLKEEQ